MSTPDGGARNLTERITVIANPRAGGGRAGADRERIHRAVDRAFAQARVLWTEAPGHATALARAAAAESDLVVALGGDGTCHEVVNGLFDDDRPVARRAIFSVVPYGTGGDLVRSLEIPRDLDRALWSAATGITLPLDVGHVRWPDRAPHVFVNVAGFGANAEVCVRANRSTKRFGGQVTFLGAIFSTLADFRAVPVRWSWDGPDGPGAVELVTFAAFLANGHYCGAGLWVGAGGSMADGVFELTLLPQVGFRDVPSLLPRMYDGRLASARGVHRARVTSVQVDGVIPVETDGEPRGSGPLHLRVLPGVLQVRGGWLVPPALR